MRRLNSLRKDRVKDVVGLHVVDVVVLHLIDVMDAILSRMAILVIALSYMDVQDAAHLVHIPLQMKLWIALTSTPLALSIIAAKRKRILAIYLKTVEMLERKQGENKNRH